MSLAFAIASRSSLVQFKHLKQTLKNKFEHSFSFSGSMSKVLMYYYVCIVYTFSGCHVCKANNQ